MKPLSQTRQAIVEEFEKKANFVDERLTKEAISFLSDYVSQALNDYTESIVRMVEGIEPKCPITSSEKWAYDQALNDIKEELGK